jgi:hypothetical protein
LYKRYSATVKAIIKNDEKHGMKAHHTRPSFNHGKRWPFNGRKLDAGRSARALYWYSNLWHTEYKLLFLLVICKVYV